MQVWTWVCGNTAVIASAKALQAIDDGDQDVFDAAVLQLVHDAQPEFRALGLLDPQAENFLGSVGPNSKSDVDGFVAHHAFVAHLDPESDACDPRRA